MTSSTSAGASMADELITYNEAARILGIKYGSVRQLVERRNLHSFPHPQDRRRRLLSRREVEARARGDSVLMADVLPLRVEVPSALRKEALLGQLFTKPTNELVDEPWKAIIVLALLLSVLSGHETSESNQDEQASEGNQDERAGLLAVIAAVGLAIVAALYAQQRISDGQRRRLELLARDAEVDPEPFIDELRLYLRAS